MGVNENLKVISNLNITNLGTWFIMVKDVLRNSKTMFQILLKIV